MTSSTVICLGLVAGGCVFYTLVQVIIQSDIITACTTTAKPFPSKAMLIYPPC